MRRFIAAILVIFMILAAAPTVFAADDTTPPVFVSISINQTEFNVGDTMAVNVKCYDTESGINYSRCSVIIKSTLEWTYLKYLPCIKTEDGFESQLTFDNSYGGTYSIVGVQIYDNRGNPGYSSSLGGDFNIAFSVNNAPYPQITNFQVDKTKAKVGDTVTYTITGSDATGIVAAGMEIYLPGASPYKSYKITMSPVQGSDGSFSGSILITRDMPGGTYYPWNVYIKGGSGLTTNADPNDMAYMYGETRVIVNNPSAPQIAKPPELISYTLSSHQLIAGQYLTVTAKLDMKSNHARIYAGIALKDSKHSIGSYKSAEMADMGNGLYVANIFIPYDSFSGEYYLNFNAADMQGNGLNFYVPDDFYTYCDNGLRYLKDGDVTVSPALTVSGTDNESILQGQHFDAAQGVTASNAYKGDATDKIQIVGGDFDTNVPGIYLVKYIVSDTVTNNGVDYHIKYTDYRWIGVTEASPPDSGSDTPLALTDGNLAVGASASDVSIQKDGKNIAYSSSLTQAGDYTLSCGGSSSTASAQGAGAHAFSLSNTSTVAAVIDRTAPSVKAAWLRDKSGAIEVSAKANDVSGIADIKYMEGDKSVDACRSGGIDTDGKFTVAGYNVYTIYAKDNLGNDGVTKITINKPSSGSAYLEGVDLTAGHLTKAFSSTSYSYTIRLGENEDNVTITPIKQFGEEGMTINGQAVSQLNVQVANNKSKTVKVVVTFGSTKKTYKFTIKRDASTDVFLKSITVSAGTLDPSFNRSTGRYKLYIDKDTGSVKISVTVNPLSKASPSSVTCKLKPGQQKTFKISVRCQAGITTFYYITIIRANV